MNKSSEITTRKKHRSKFWPTHRYTKLFLTAVFIGLLALGFAVTMTILNPTQRIDRNSYQVVYMTNGQLYFGKLQNVSGEFLQLKSPYIEKILQVDTANDTSKDAPKTTLIKATDQLYGPEDSIALKSSQVLYWQNLREDSKVTSVINEQLTKQ